MKLSTLSAAVALTVLASAANAATPATCFGTTVSGATYSGSANFGLSSFCTGTGGSANSVVDLYTFTTTTDFKIDGVFYGISNYDSGGIFLVQGGTSTNLGPYFNTHTTDIYTGVRLPTTGEQTFGAGTYTLQLNWNTALYSNSSTTTARSNFGQAFITAVPEPETYAMMLAGLGAIGFMARRRKQG